MDEKRVSHKGGSVAQQYTGHQLVLCEIGERWLKSFSHTDYLSGETLIFIYPLNKHTQVEIR